MELFDTHSHYNDESFDGDRDIIIKEVYEKGVTKLVCIGYNLESSRKAVQIANQYDFIYATCGISPNDVTENSSKELEEISELAKDPKVVAIAEIGLDYHYTKENMDLQKKIFIKQIEIANELDLPIAIHTRDAQNDTIEILTLHPCNNTGIFHCCPLNVELIKKGLKLGYYISFSGVVTFKNAKPQLAIAEVPLDRILIETDCPYLAPEPYRGKRNYSAYIIETLKKIAVEKNTPVENLAQITYDNAKRVYKIK